MDIETTLEKRFWARVKKDDGCWVWVGEVQPNGYGRMQFHSRRMSAHRLGYMLQVGSIPDKHLIHHKCQNRSCVRADHLAAISPAEHTREHEDSRYGY